jgi:predicted DsbA family dithiol-disulfide isomerase
VIGSYCILCIALYAVNLLLLFFSWIVRRRFNCGPFFHALGEDLRHLSLSRPLNAIALCGLLAAFVGVKTSYPAYWLFHPVPLPARISTGVTPEGRPWIGAENPVLEIIEFADYQCFQCKKMYYHLRELIAKYPEKIRLVHAHYPMDHEFNPMVKDPFHIGSGKMALLTVYAAAEGKFWDVHDLLYQWAGHRDEIDLRELASQTGLPADRLAESTENRRFREKLVADIRYGMEHAVQATPSYLIEGKMYPGTIPPEVFRGIVY